MQCDELQKVIMRYLTKTYILFIITQILRMARPFRALGGFLLASCVAVSDFESDFADNDWIIFRGSPLLSGYVDRALPDNPKLHWTFSNDVRTVSSPIIYGGKAYTCDRKGVVRGIDEQGKQFFSHNLNTTVEASFIIRDSVMYIGKIDGKITALSLSTKKILWEYETLGQISASPNIIQHEADELLLIGSYDNSMYTFSTSSGKKVSQFETGYYINGAASVWGNYMLFGGCDGWLRMVNTITGEQTDSMQLKAYVPASPAVMGDYAFVSDYNGNLYELQLADGRIAKHRLLITAKDGEESSGVVSMPTVSANAIYILTNDRHIRCIERSNGKERWSKMLRGDAGESAPLVCKDKVLVCTKDGHVSILSADNGKEVWHYEVGEQIIASPAVLSDCFYIQTSRGKLLMFK